jgi:hybrid cluster-associated redox disulfide protein
MEISRDTAVEELLNEYPYLAKVLIELGLPCLVCGQAFWGTIEDLCRQNNIPVDKVLAKLNERKQIDNETL